MNGAETPDSAEVFTTCVYKKLLSTVVLYYFNP
jgi:hypothetical protein